METSAEEKKGVDQGKKEKEERGFGFLHYGK